MSKTFMLYFENDDVDGFQVMKALKKFKGYHHVQDITDVTPVDTHVHEWVEADDPKYWRYCKCGLAEWKVSNIIRGV